MNYYEELAVAQDASLEEIRLAYRALARILHPDNQAEPKLKSAAERQMVRLNQTLAILADPEKRRRYDESLCAKRAVSGAFPPPPPASIPLLRRNASWILASCILVGVGLWYWRSNEFAEPIADRSTGRSLQATEPVPPESAPRPSKKQALGENRVLLSQSRVPQGESQAFPDDDRPPDKSPGRPKSSLPPENFNARETSALGEPSRVAGPSEPVATVPAVVGKAAGLAVEAAQAVPESPPQRPTGQSTAPVFAGRWLYALGSHDRQTPGMYPPEFIEFFLSEEQGVLSGTYWARYHIPDKPVSPEVQFRVYGTPQAGNVASLKWVSADGANGQLRMVLRDSNSLEVTWWTTAFGRQTALASGTAVLERQRAR